MNFINEVIRDALKSIIILLKAMVPVTITVKILSELGLVTYIAGIFEPFMNIVGLPGEMALVFGTSFMTTIYGGLMCLFTLSLPDISVHDITVLAVMMLTAHAFPSESAIIKQAKSSPVFMGVLRLASAFVLGYIIHIILGGSAGTKSANISMMTVKGKETWAEWGISQLKSYLMIFVILILLLILMKLLKKYGVIDFINKALSPVFTAIGISEKAAPLVIIGFTMGLTYGAGLIINEVENGKLTKNDIFYSIGFLSICHSIIEDSLIFLALGANGFGIIVVRLLYTFILIFMLKKLNDKFNFTNKII